MSFSKPSLPPGPRGLPIIGNMGAMPTEKEWITFKQWGEKYGPIMSVTVAGHPVIVVNSPKIMLDKFSGQLYADRPKLEFAGESVGYSKTLVLLPYGKRFGEYRKHIRAVVGTRPIVERDLATLEQYENHRFLQALLAEPDNLVQHLRKMNGSIILKVTYGIESDSEIAEFIRIIEGANENFSIATSSGAVLIDLVPAFKFLPSWTRIPGAGFNAMIPKFKKAFDDMVEKPYERAKVLIVKLNHGQSLGLPSCVSKALASLEKNGSETEDQEFNIKHAAASMYGGGADTTMGCQHAFVLAMILHPDVQKKAQKEIDSITEGQRLPTLADRNRMPYARAMVTETLRWHSVAPTAVPHRAMTSSVVSGTCSDGRQYQYLIPEDSTIIFNTWGMLQSEETYPDSSEFKPERYLKANPELDPRKICFGAGVRSCPGANLAEASLFMFIVMTLAVFEITPARDDYDRPILPLPRHENMPGTISHPEPFAYTIRPRSAAAISLINSEPLAP